VMRHEGANNVRFSARQTRRGIVDRLIEAILPFKSFRGKPLQIEACLLGATINARPTHTAQRHILGESAFEPQAGHAKCAVLVGETHVDRVVARFRNTHGTPRCLPYSIWCSTAALYVSSSSVFRTLASP